MFRNKKYRFRPEYLSQKLMMREKSRKKKLLISAGVFLLLAAAALCGMLFSPFLKIRQVSVFGAGEKEGLIREKCLAAMEEKIFFGRIGRDNFLFFPDEKLSGEISRDFPELKFAGFKKEIKAGSLLAEFGGRSASAVWCPAWFDSSATSSQAMRPEIEKCFFIDEQGFVFREAPILSGSMFATIFDISFGGKGIGSLGLDKNKLDFILETKKEMISRNLDMGDFLVRPEAASEIEVITSDGWRLFLDLASPPAIQIDSLVRALNEEIKEKRSQLEYVDLRVPGRIYYKLK